MQLQINDYGVYSLDENNEIKVKLSSSFNFNFRTIFRNTYNILTTILIISKIALIILIEKSIYHNNGDSWGYYNNKFLK